MSPGRDLVDRFSTDLGALIPAGSRLGLAVSGGPDSLALLLLAAAGRPGEVEAATINHGLRAEAAEEAAMVAGVCARLNVPHASIEVKWDAKPATAIQERARDKRYRSLGFWAEERGLAAIVTAHHADDQAETVMMRLSRGAGVRGLAGMHPNSVAPGTEVRLLRPLLGWRRAELEAICEQAGVTPVSDPSNEDERFERVRVRRDLNGADWLDAAAIARSASYLAEADSALNWAARVEWKKAVHAHGKIITYRPSGAPREILRRIASRAVRHLASEGEAGLRGAEVDRLLDSLLKGGTATLRGVLCRGGEEWRFSPAPERRT